MFLLIPCPRDVQNVINVTLHSTMFLLIPEGLQTATASLQIFTFHDVSINTRQRILRSSVVITFTFHDVSINTKNILGESTFKHNFTFHDVSINTFFLFCKDWRNSSNFTFHDVSINTLQLLSLMFSRFSLHSTMFLLILNFSASQVYMFSLYIPRCFY